MLEIWRHIFTSLTMLGCEAKTSICSAIKENLILYCGKFSALVVAVINQFILFTRTVLERDTVCKRNH